MKQPFLFIDDEADWASHSTKSDEDPTAINKAIRNILTLFHKSTYIAYTATPFANIFINHESRHDMWGDDLFPKDFMIRLALSEVYRGQSFYFPHSEEQELLKNYSPIINIPVEAQRFQPPTRKSIKKMKIDLDDSSVDSLE